MPSGNYHRFRQEHELIEGTRGPYWKLNYNLTINEINTILKRNGYTGVKVSSLRTELIAALKKVERGLLQYRKYEIPELRKFLDDRKIEYRIDSTKNDLLIKEDLVMCLKKADKNPQFNLLMKLPLEVRKFILRECMLAYEGMKSTIELPVQPAITRVSREIRDEALDIFYGENRFALFCNRYLKSAQEGDFTIEQRLHSTTRMFLEMTEDVNLARMRHVEFRFTGARVRTTNGNLSHWLTAIHIDIRPKGEGDGQYVIKPVLTAVPQLEVRNGLAGSNQDEIDRVIALNSAVVKAGGQLGSVLGKLAKNVGAAKFGRAELTAIAKALKERMDPGNPATSNVATFFIL